MKIINGNELALNLDNKIVELVKDSSDHGNLAIIQIGNNPASNTYIKIKQKIAEKVGITCVLYKFDSNKTIEYLQQEVTKIVNDKNNTGVIIQLPLPISIKNQLLDLVPVEKDIDLLSSNSQNFFYSNLIDYGSPITRATEYILDSLELIDNNLNVLVVGSGFLVGKPIIHMLKRKKIRVSYTNNYSKKLCNDKNLIILCAGVPKLVKGEDLQKNTSVIDFGYSLIDKKTVGDFDLRSKTDHLNYIVPSPNGMGPLVVRFLLLNHIKKYNI